MFNGNLLNYKWVPDGISALCGSVFGHGRLIEIFPHIIVWGSCSWMQCTSRFLLLLSSSSPPPPPPPSFTHHLSHKTLSHTIFHIHLCHPPSFTYTVYLGHTSFTHNFHTPSLSHTIFYTHLCHTHHLSHTICPTHLFCVAGAALMTLGWVHLVPVGRPWRRGPFAWQAWHLPTFILTLRGRHGTLRHPASFCVTGAALMTLGWVW